MHPGQQRLTHPQFLKLHNLLQTRQEKLLADRPRLDELAASMAQELGFRVGISSVREALDLLKLHWTPLRKARVVAAPQVSASAQQLRALEETIAKQEAKLLAQNGRLNMLADELAQVKKTLANCIQMPVQAIGTLTTLSKPSANGHAEPSLFGQLNGKAG